MSYTPKPWVVGEPNKGPVSGTVPVHTADYMESYRSGQLVCSVYGTAAFSSANARLISAAPDLYEALRDIVDAADGTGWDQLDATFTQARAALKKARGER